MLLALVLSMAFVTLNGCSILGLDDIDLEGLIDDVSGGDDHETEQQSVSAYGIYGTWWWDETAVDDAGEPYPNYRWEYIFNFDGTGKYREAVCGIPHTLTTVRGDYFHYTVKKNVNGRLVLELKFQASRKYYPEGTTEITITSIQDDSLVIENEEGVHTYIRNE